MVLILFFLPLRSLCEEVFQKYSEWERIEKFSRPKVLRLLEVLRIFRPSISKKQLENGDCQPADCVAEIVLEDASADTSKQTIEPTSSSELPDHSQMQSRQPVSQPLYFSRRRRTDFPIRHHRTREDAHQLCAIIFTESRTTAKLLYHLLKVFDERSRLFHIFISLLFYCLISGCQSL